MVEQFQNLAESISGIVTSAIDGEWGDLASNIVGTIGNSVELGSSAAEASSEVEA